MRKLQWLLALIMVLVLAVACGGTTEPAAEPTTEPMTEPTTEAMAETDCASPDLRCIGVVTDVGQIDDKSFNQSAWEGAQTAITAFGAKVEYVETRDATDYANNLASIASLLHPVRHRYSCAHAKNSIELVYWRKCAKRITADIAGNYNIEFSERGKDSSMGATGT